MLNFTVKESVPVRMFALLRRGDTFLSTISRDLYMVLDNCVCYADEAEDTDDPEVFNAICLSDGRLFLFQSTDQVYPVQVSSEVSYGD